MRPRNREHRRDRGRRRSIVDETQFPDAEAVASVARVRRRNRRGPVGSERDLWHEYLSEPVPGASSAS